MTKYCTLALLKQYLIGTTAVASGNTTVFNQGVVSTPDDTILTDLINQAESDFDLLTGTGYDQQTLTLVQAFYPFVDNNGWMHLFARERGPVTAVTAIQTRDVWGGQTVWQDVTFTADNIIYPPFMAADTYPRPESWMVMVYPANPLPPRATGQILARWTYTGGFQTIPTSLAILVARMSAYLYKLREMPAGKVINQPLGTMTVPADYPPDIRRDLRLWAPQYQ